MDKYIYTLQWLLSETAKFILLLHLIFLHFYEYMFLWECTVHIFLSYCYVFIFVFYCIDFLFYLECNFF
jgi:hypothetical protein